MLEVVWDPPLVVHFISISQLIHYDMSVTTMVVMIHSSVQVFIDRRYAIFKYIYYFLPLPSHIYDIY